VNVSNKLLLTADKGQFSSRGIQLAINGP